MSLLYEREGPPGPLPALAGKEVLIDPMQADICMVKGSMFAGRRKFLREQFGDQEFEAVLAKLSPRTQPHASSPLSVRWCEFGALVEYDKVIHEHFKARHPHILALVGAASAEYGIGTVYKSLDTAELVKFLEGIARFHDQFLKFGRVLFVRTAQGASLSHYDYPCYSPIFCASAVLLPRVGHAARGARRGSGRVAVSLPRRRRLPLRPALDLTTARAVEG